jgi:predicted NAD/FAD-binding protein
MNADTAIASTRHDDLISILVNTYRELNTHVRQVPEDRLIAGGEQSSVRGIIARMRTDEMRFAQALKQRVTGVVIGGPEGQDPVIVGASPDDTTAMLISQFGTARETTLSLLKDLTDDDWTKPIDDGSTILGHVQELTRSDQTQLQRIKQLLG